jgi:hypothetical protein
MDYALSYAPEKKRVKIGFPPDRCVCKALDFSEGLCYADLRNIHEKIKRRGRSRI